MNKEIKILDELRDLIPPLNKEELAQLHREIETDGRANVPLTVWKQENVLVDGHHRYSHCMKHGFPFEVRRLSFTDINTVKNHMILHQLGRRNLDPKAAAKLIGKLYKNRKQEHGGQISKGSTQNGNSLRTAEQVAKETGVSKNTVIRNEKFADAVDDITELVTNKKITEQEKTEIMKKPMAQIVKAAASPDAAKKAAKPKPPRKRAAKVEPHKRVVEGFKKLDIKQMEKAITQIDKIWNSQ